MWTNLTFHMFVFIHNVPASNINISDLMSDLAESITSSLNPSAEDPLSLGDRTDAAMDLMTRP